MQRCYNNKLDKITNLITLIFFSAIGIFIFALGVFMVIFKVYWVDLVAAGFSMLAGTAVASLGLFLYAMRSMEYSLDAKGVSVRYLRRYVKWYSWEELHDISVCDINHASKMIGSFELVIRISVQEEAREPRKHDNPYWYSRHDVWRKQMYSLTHFRTVIPIEYTPERYAEIKAVCGREILDRRTKECLKYRPIEFPPKLDKD